MKIRALTIFLICSLGYPSFTLAQTPEDRTAIRAIMDQQVRCWNEGNLACFMEGYWPSDSLMFIGGSGIIYGFDSTLKRYQKTYPDRANMGTLRFEIVSLDFLAEDAGSMVGKYFLTRSVGDANGHFTLLFRKLDGQWYIVQDHSSQAEKKE